MEGIFKRSINHRNKYHENGSCLDMVSELWSSFVPVPWTNSMQWTNYKITSPINKDFVHLFWTSLFLKLYHKGARWMEHYLLVNWINRMFISFTETEIMYTILIKTFLLRNDSKIRYFRSYNYVKRIHILIKYWF